MPVTAPFLPIADNDGGKIGSEDLRFSEGHFLKGFFEEGNFKDIEVTGNVTGDLIGDVTGNADTATKLKDPVNINGVPFDGSEDIEIANGLPPGTIITYAATSIPEGYLKCNGASISRATYADLFAVIGTTYGGSGDNFTLPDLRGEFVRGWTDGRSGVDSGRSFGSTQGDAIRNITGKFGANHKGWEGPFASGVFSLTIGSSSGQGWTGGASSAQPPQTYSFDASKVVSTAAENRPRNIAMQFLIKY